MRYFLLAACLTAVMAVPKIKTCVKCTKSYSNFVILDPLRDLTMYWELGTAQDINIAIETPGPVATGTNGASGWLYVGLSENGQHHNRSDGKLPSDAWGILVTNVAMHPCNPGCILDLWIPSDPKTFIDTKDDLTNKKVGVANGYLTAEFTRKLDTGDTQDLPIDPTSVGQVVLWGTRDDDGRPLWGVDAAGTPLAAGLFAHHSRTGDRVAVWDRTKRPRTFTGTAPNPNFSNQNSRKLANSLTDNYDATFYWSLGASFVDMALVANVPDGTLMLGFSQPQNQFGDHFMRCPAPVSGKCGDQYNNPPASAYVTDGFAGGVSHDTADPLCSGSGCILELFMKQDDRQPLWDNYSNPSITNPVVTKTASHLMIQFRRALTATQADDVNIVADKPITIIWGVNPVNRPESPRAPFASAKGAVPPRGYIPWHEHRDDFVIQLNDATYNAPLSIPAPDCVTHNGRLSKTYPNCVTLDTLGAQHFWMYWGFNGTGANARINIGLVGEGVDKGWMGIGLSPDRLHIQRTDPTIINDGWIATLAGNVSHLIDANFPDELNMVIDTTSNLDSGTVSAVGGFLIAEFSRLLDTKDTAGDRVLDPCTSPTTFMWATRSSPQYTTYTGGWPVLFHHDYIHRGTADVILAAPPDICPVPPGRSSASFISLWFPFSALLFAVFLN